MSNARDPAKTAPHRGAARLGGEKNSIPASDLLGFAETLVREAGDIAPVLGAAIHMLGTSSSVNAVGEAVCLSRSANSIWRVTIADETGAGLAEVTLTLGGAEPPVSLVPTTPRRNRDVEDRRTKIARAAQDVFAEKGYAAATMREIAAAAGMHVPTMYQYFRSKEEILELVYSWTINRAVDGMRTVLARKEPPDAHIDAIVRRLHDVNDELRRGTLVMNRETRSLSRAARSRVLSHYAGMVQDISRIIAEGQHQGLFRNVDPHLAAVFIDALADVWVLRPFAVGATDPDIYAAELVAFVRGALSQDTAKTSNQSEPPRNQQE